jgi:hypothetical protein
MHLAAELDFQDLESYMTWNLFPHLKPTMCRYVVPPVDNCIACKMISTHALCSVHTQFPIYHKNVLTDTSTNSLLRDGPSRRFVSVLKQTASA